MTQVQRSRHERDPEKDRLARVIRRTRRAMVFERLLQAFWPLAALAALAWSAIAFGLAEIAARREVVLALGLLGIAAGCLLWQGIARFRRPSLRDARARVDATLPGRPLAGLADRPALGADDPGARRVWAAHRARLQRAAAAAEAVGPDPKLARHDPWALRLAALVILGAALLFARPGGIDTVAAALTTETAAAAGPSFEGWAEPPDHTGRPALYLPDVTADQPVSLPQGTRLTIRAYGAPKVFALAEDVSGRPGGAMLAEDAPGISSAEFDLTRDGRLALARNGRQIAAWRFLAEADKVPDINLDGEITAGPEGDTRLPFVASDDYGITAGRVEITLDESRIARRYGLAVAPEPRPALTADLPMPMAGPGHEVREMLVEDFSKHPWAGLPVKIRLVAEDAIGQQGVRDDVVATLPGRGFYDPAAAALIEQRRDLLWSTENAPRVIQVLRAVTWRPEGLFDSNRAYLVVRAAIRQLAEAEAAGTVPEVRDEVAEALWQAALLLEEGSLGDAAQRLAKAKERLQEALRNGASDQEIAKLMDDLRQATRDYMDQMAQEAIERGENQQAEATPPGQTMTQDQIQQLMDRIQELSEQGRKAEAEQMLEMLQQLLDNMEMRMTEGGQPGNGQKGAGEQSMQGLSDALREQQGLADESFQQLQREFRQGRQGQQGEGGEPGQSQGGDGDTPGQQQSEEGGPGQPQGEGPSREQLAQRQQALREMMEQLRDGLPGAAGEGTEQALRDAERNMEEAEKGLEQGDTPGALDRQSQAIDSIREGMQALGREMRQAEGQGEQNTAEGEAQSSRGMDPLGRPLGARGSIGTNEQIVPGADATARARALLDEIRRRAGELGRPEIELDYLRRLLDRF